jgi:FdrA protein
VLQQVAQSEKPTVVCLLGVDPGSVRLQAPQHVLARTLEEAARLAAEFIHPPGIVLEGMTAAGRAEAERPAALRSRLAPGQRFLRGLFSGGTLCYEAQVIWNERLSAKVLSNAPLDAASQLPDSLHSQGHTAVDLGEEEFTVGRPHPMIDNDLRIRRLLQEARDPQAAVILLDVVIGYGAHPDPAAELGRAVEEAQALARGEGRELLVVASVTGTEGDPQGLSRTISTLTRSGVTVCDSNAAAARLTAWIVSDRAGSSHD